MGRQRFLSLGGLNARQFPIGYNDVEFMLRCSRAGLTHLYLGHVSASHRRGSSRTGDNEDLQALWAGQSYPAEAGRRFQQLAKERVGIQVSAPKKESTGQLKDGKPAPPVERGASITQETRRPPASRG